MWTSSAEKPASSTAEIIEARDLNIVGRCVDAPSGISDPRRDVDDRDLKRSSGSQHAMQFGQSGLQARDHLQSVGAHDRSETSRPERERMSVASHRNDVG